MLVDELPMEFHCDLQLKDRSLTVNGIASGAGGGVADGIPLCFATVGSFPQCRVVASRLLRAVAALVILLSFAAGSRKSYWSGCMKAATVICQQIFSILALVIFLLKSF